MKKTIALITILLAICSCSSSALAISTIDYKAKKIAAKASDLRPEVVKLALNAYNNSKKLGVAAKKPIVTVIDYSLPSTKKRLWVVDIDQEKILHTSLLAHGKYSGENHTTAFSNTIGSKQTSIGVFLTENTYYGRDGYSLKIEGLEKGFNDKAKVRTIVMHGAPYVSQEFIKAVGRAGRSWGCPAVEKPLARPIIDTIKNGTLIVSFYPDKEWLSNSKFISKLA